MVALHSGQSEPQRDILSLKQGPLLQPAEDWKPTCLTLYPWALASWLLSVARIFSHPGQASPFSPQPCNHSSFQYSPRPSQMSQPGSPPTPRHMPYSTSLTSSPLCLPSETVWAAGLATLSVKLRPSQDGGKGLCRGCRGGQ